MNNHKFNSCVHKEEGDQEIEVGCCFSKVHKEIKDTVYCKKRRIYDLKPSLCFLCNVYEDSGRINRVIETSAEIYQDITGLSVPRRNFSLQLTKLLDNQLKDLDEQKLKEWAAGFWTEKLKEALNKKIEERSASCTPETSSFFYKDPFIILLAWIITNNSIESMTILKQIWPRDVSFIKEYCEFLGVMFVWV